MQALSKLVSDMSGATDTLLRSELTEAATSRTDLASQLSQLRAEQASPRLCRARTCAEPTPVPSPHLCCAEPARHHPRFPAAAAHRATRRAAPPARRSCNS